MKYFAGIDGGGTKTTLLVRSENQDTEYRNVYGAFNINSIGIEGLSSVMDSIISDLKKLGECLYLTIGAAGVSNSDMREIVHKKLIEADIDYKLVGDHEIALEGAHGGGPGIAVIAGTGSICFGKGENGLLCRTGGWGHIIGDGGSAYAIAKDAFAAVVKVLDGYGKKTILTKILSEKLSLNDRDDYVHFIYSGDKSTIASIAPLVCEAYAEGDEIAIEIIRNNAFSLFEALQGVKKKTGLKKAYVSFFGGLLDKETPFRREFLKDIEDNDSLIEYRRPIFDAATGAVMLSEKSFLIDKNKFY